MTTTTDAEPDSPAAGPDLTDSEQVGVLASGPALIGDQAADECCSLSRTSVDAPTAESMATRFKALSDPTRLLLLSHIAARGCESVCACDLLDVVDISQPTVSHHLKRLVDSSLLAREQRGKWAHYTVVRGALDDLRGFLDLA